MMKSILILSLSLSLALKVRENATSKTDATLMSWLAEGDCWNLALIPQYNNQHSVFGVTEFLRKNNLAKNLGGVSACSGGTLPGAYLAANVSFDAFNKTFPHGGWGGFGPSEPKITDDYEGFLKTNLPTTFEELKKPFALSLTEWGDLKGLKTFNPKSARGFVAKTGNLYHAMTAAVTTSSMQMESCPYCSVGFWPRKVNGRFPVTDGAYGDILGLAGLPELPKCSKLLHVLPIDYAGQVAPPAPKDIPTTPKELVSLVLVQPPTASHAYMLEKAGAGSFITKKTSSEWTNAMYTGVSNAMKEVANKALKWKLDDTGSKAAILTLDTKLPETTSEKVFDRAIAQQRDLFWEFWKDDKAIQDWNKTMYLTKKVDKRHIQRLLMDTLGGKL